MQINGVLNLSDNLKVMVLNYYIRKELCKILRKVMQYDCSKTLDSNSKLQKSTS